MKNKLILLVLVFFVGHAMAQGKGGKLTAKDLSGTQWTAVKIWNVSHYDGEEDFEVPREEFGEWAAFVELNFISETELEGAQMNGKTFKSPYSIKKKTISYHFEEKESQYTWEVFVDAKFSVISATKFTMEADFCQDGCVYRIEYEKE